MKLETASSTAIRYEITQGLVELGIAAEHLITEFKQSIWFNFTPAKMQVQNIIAKFEGKVRDATQTLDKAINAFRPTPSIGA